MSSFVRYFFDFIVTPLSPYININNFDHMLIDFGTELGDSSISDNNYVVVGNYKNQLKDNSNLIFPEIININGKDYFVIVKSGIFNANINKLHFNGEHNLSLIESSVINDYFQANFGYNPKLSVSNCTISDLQFNTKNININGYAFFNCNIGSTLHLNGHVNVAGWGFSNCDGLKNIVINAQSLTLQERAFPSNYYLEELTIDCRATNVNWIGEYILYNSMNVFGTKMIYMHGMTEIEYNQLLIDNKISGGWRMRSNGENIPIVFNTISFVDNVYLDDVRTHFSTAAMVDGSSIALNANWIQDSTNVDIEIEEDGSYAYLSLETNEGVTTANAVPIFENGEYFIPSNIFRVYFHWEVRFSTDGPISTLRLYQPIEEDWEEWE